MPVKLINVFQVPEEHHDEFLKPGSETTQVYARTEGFLEAHLHRNKTHLHRNTVVGNKDFEFINIALWASPEAFVQAHKDFVPGEESIPGIAFHPAIFEEVIMTKNLLFVETDGRFLPSKGNFDGRR